MVLVLAGPMSVWAQDQPADVGEAREGRVGDEDSGKPTGGEASGIEVGHEESDKPWMQGVPFERREKARAIFLEGNVLIKDTLFAQAAARYKEALAIWENPAIYFNLAVAQLNLDQPIEAYRSLENALQYGAEPLGKNRYEQARNYVSLLEKQLARIEVVCEQPGVSVALDGRVLFTAPGRYRNLARPGGHQLVASKTGYLTESQEIVLSPGKERRIEIALSTLEDVRESSRRWAAWKPWTVVSAGAVVTLIGGVVHWRASVDYDGFDRDFRGLECAEDGGCSEDDLAAYTPRLRSARWKQRVAVASYAVGGAVLATGLVLTYLNRPKLTEDEPASTPGAISVTPLLTPEQAGITAELRF